MVSKTSTVDLSRVLLSRVPFLVRVSNATGCRTIQWPVLDKLLPQR
jgi:hypothetical protein